jgi:hypothetical protein
MHGDDPGVLAVAVATPVGVVPRPCVTVTVLVKPLAPGQVSVPVPDLNAFPPSAPCNWRISEKMPVGSCVGH